MMETELHSTTKSFLEWGRLSLSQHTGERDFPDGLEKSILAHEDLGREFRNDLDKIIKAAREALDFLNKPELLRLTDDDLSWNQVIEAFDRLDQLVQFMEATEKLLPHNNQQLADELLKIAADAYEQVSEFFFSPEFSSLRLTVFQEHRRTVLQDIHPENHYLFPWYDLYSHVDPDALPLIAEHISDPENLPQDIKNELPAFLADIQNDKVLRDYIREQHLALKQLEKMIETHWSLRLLRFVEQINLDKILPEMVEQKGAARLSRSLQQSSTLSVQDRFALGLSAALFAPDIKETERLKLLEQCEKTFDSIREIQGPENLSGRVIQRLNELKLGRLSIEEAVQAVLDYWIDQLNTVHAEERKSKADMADLARNVLRIEDIDDTESNKDIQQGKYTRDQRHTAGSWTDKLKSWLGKPVVLVPALAVILVMISVPLIMRQQDPMHMDLEMLVYQAHPLITRSDEPETVITKESGAVLSSQDCFQLLFTPTRDVYAYLLHQDTQGRVTKYFEGKLEKNQTRTFPDEDSRACFTEESGSEVFYLVYFDEAVDGFEGLAARLSEVEGPLEQEILDKFSDAQIEQFILSYN
ncbi:type III-E CRISPR-associated protein Csx30 [Desulfonatronospira sp.]|uniref:type III-E CRISPR-associated protein Csx30 n=1 Tax=Desulfonatronospira sp. TaxID=1962951 RepID=UPI0025BF176A|nr:type III-E CRISPR-associated protein Csx30 [Desulfonatronospira sp.]